MRERVFVMRRVTMRRTHRRFEAVAGPGTARRRVGHRKPAVAAVGSNHPAQEEDLAQNSFHVSSHGRLAHKKERGTLGRIVLLSLLMAVVVVVHAVEDDESDGEDDEESEGKRRTGSVCAGGYMATAAWHVADAGHPPSWLCSHSFDFDFAR